MKKINYFLSSIMFIFILCFAFMDSYTPIPITRWVHKLFDSFSYSGDDLFSSIFTLNISLYITIIGIAFAIISFILSKSSITFTAYINYISKIDPVRENTIIVLISLLISLLSTYLRYTYIVEIWFKVSLLYPIIFVFIITKNVTRIESKIIINQELLKLMLNDGNYIGFFNEIYVPVNKEDLYSSLSDTFLDLVKKTTNKNKVFEIYDHINTTLIGIKI